MEIMCELPYVSLDILSRLPPDGEIEFFIDLEPGIALVSKALYRMNPKELEELKI